MLVDAILKRDVVTVDRDHTILSCARRMRDSGVGCVVVVDERNRPVGIVTDRDIVVKSTAALIEPSEPVDTIMSTPVFAVGQDLLVFDLLRELAARKLQRVVVVDEKKTLIGMVNVNDVLLLLTSEMANVAEVVGRNAV